MKNIRYVLLSPLIHFTIAAPLIYYQQAKTWEYIPHIQAVQDTEKESWIPSGEEQFAWSPCYEYRPSIANKFVYTVEFPAGVLIGLDPTHNGCDPGALALVLRRHMHHVRLKTAIVILNCLLAVGICAQWSLVGLWIDRLRRSLKPARRWTITVGVITVAGVSMAQAGFGTTGWRELVAMISGFLALLAWIVLLAMFAITAITSTLQKIRRAS
jgi:hypothetical protein